MSTRPCSQRLLQPGFKERDLQLEFLSSLGTFQTVMTFGDEHGFVGVRGEVLQFTEICLGITLRRVWIGKALQGPIPSEEFLTAEGCLREGQLFFSRGVVLCG